MTGNLIGTQLNDATGFFSKNKSVLIIAFVLLFGMFIGSWSISLCDDNKYYGIAGMFQQFLVARGGQTFLYTLFFSILSYLPVILCCYIFGLCIIGTPAAFIIPLVKGISMGLVSGYLYSAYSLKGIGFFALIMMPGMFISSLVTIFASRETMRFSASLFYNILPSAKAIQMCDGFRIYSVKFIFFFIITVLCALTDSVMSVAFLKFFSF